MRPLDRVPAEVAGAVCRVKPCEPVHSSTVHGLAGIVKPPGGVARSASRRGAAMGHFPENISLDKKHSCLCAIVYNWL